jgi:hypothetical protein
MYIGTGREQLRIIEHHTNLEVVLIKSARYKQPKMSSAADLSTFASSSIVAIANVRNQCFQPSWIKLRIIDRDAN